MTESQEAAEINYEEQYRTLLEKHEKLSIDIASLQLSNRSLVNQNRDEKKKVMDCRLQISDLESRMKNLENIKKELSESQNQAERLRQSLDANENKLASFEKRATESEGLVRVKDSIIDKQRKFSKELEDKVKMLSEELEGLNSKCSNLEQDLSNALERAEECDNLREVLAAKTALLNKLAESSDGVSAEGLAAANEFFRQQEARLNEQITEIRGEKRQLEENLNFVTSERVNLLEKTEVQTSEIESLKEKCATLETRVKESNHTDKRSKGDMSSSRLIGPSLPPWILEEKKTDPSDMEKLNNADPATLRARVLDLEGKVHELNQLLTYREDVILRIYQEIQKKSSRLEAAEVERSSLSAQVNILKRELEDFRDVDGGGGGCSRRGFNPSVEIEIERLRGKRDREYQRRKRAEAEMDEMEVELTDVKEKMKKLEEEMVELAAAPKPVINSGDPIDKSRIAELQSVVNQLRMDNESKRSELFDLRSRFDEKSAQLDAYTSEMKTKERQVNDLSAELVSKTNLLEMANKELETVRLRVVRGGVETERWQTDLNSVRVSNRFLSRQISELRDKLANTESQLITTEKLHVALDDGRDRDAGTPVCNGISKINGSDKENALRNENDSRRIEQLIVDLKREQKAAKASAERCTELTNQICELEASLASLQERLAEANCENRRTSLEQATTISSPPNKRARRTRASSSNSISDCPSCSELKRQVQILEIDLNGANATVTTSYNELNDLREKLAKTGEDACHLRHELSAIREELITNPHISSLVETDSCDDTVVEIDLKVVPQY